MSGARAPDHHFLELSRLLGHGVAARETAAKGLGLAAALIGEAGR